MRPRDTRGGHEGASDSLNVWRPWQLNQLELLEAHNVFIPSCQRYTQEYKFVFWQVGSLLSHQYRNMQVSGKVDDGMFFAIEPGETWTCCAERLQLPQSHDRRGLVAPVRHPDVPLGAGDTAFPSHLLYDPSLCQAVYDLAVRSQTPASRLQQEETLLRVFAPLLLTYAEDTKGLWPVGQEHAAIQDAKAYLEAHYTEEIALHQLATVVKLSPFHLARICRQTVGLSPHAYQTQLRLARAKTLLAQGWEVSFVASETGFFDQSHFTQQFKRYRLVTPGRYRKTARFS